MKLWLVATLAILAALTSGRAGVERSVSTSRQFIVYGADAQLRGALCDVAEQTKKSALGLLRESDSWKTPILINAQLPQAQAPESPRAQLSFGQTGFGLKLQLDLTIDADISAPSIEREILRAVYLEMMYRAVPETPAGTPYVEPPAWLLEGTLALASHRDPAALAATLSTPVETGAVVSLDQFLSQQPELLDSPSRALYRAYAAALVSALLENANGSRQLTRYLAELPLSLSDSVADFRAHFPAFNGAPENVQKVWTLAVARLAGSQRYRLLGPEETERELSRLLRIELRERDQTIGAYMLEEYPRFLRIGAAAAALKHLREELLLLSGRANPLYRPVLAEYDKIVEQLGRGKTKKLPQRLAELRALREHLSRHMSAIADYMNWFEATQARSTSGAFHDYLRAAEVAVEREYRRKDAISLYLDALETQF